jgi:hypothetical protein
LIPSETAPAASSGMLKAGDYLLKIKGKSGSAKNVSTAQVQEVICRISIIDVI